MLFNNWQNTCIRPIISSYIKQIKHHAIRLIFIISRHKQNNIGHLFPLNVDKWLYEFISKQSKTLSCSTSLCAMVVNKVRFPYFPTVVVVIVVVYRIGGDPRTK